MRTNKRETKHSYTHEGAIAHPEQHLTPLQKLRRATLACLLFEDEFYEDGVSIAERIAELATQVKPVDLAAVAIEARTTHNLRHVSLWLAVHLARHNKGALVSQTLAQVIQRADELGEFVSLYAKANEVSPKEVKKKLSAQVKKGLAVAFHRFDEYQLAKYNRDVGVTLRDVLRLVHPRPDNQGATEMNPYMKGVDKAALWKRVLDDKLVVPETWEVLLSRGKNKRDTFTELLTGQKLGYMALLRNLRNMEQAGVDRDLVREAILARRGARRVLPFRFFTAAKHAPMFEATLDKAMLDHMATLLHLPGKTGLIVDISGSMDQPLSAKGEVFRVHAACMLAAIVREQCEHAVIFATAGNDGHRKHATAMIPSRHGMALVDAITGMRTSLGGGGIFLKQASEHIAEREKNFDRMIVITDEQDCDNRPGGEPAQAPLLGKTNFLINVGSYKHGIGYGRWCHMDGFSENVLTYISEYEKELAGQNVQAT